MHRPVFVQLRDLSAGYGGGDVLRDIDLTIREGERLAVVGKSGAGKSTLLTLIYRRAAARTTARRTVLIPQALGLVPNLSVFHNIYMGRLADHGVMANLRQLIAPSGAASRAVGEIAAALDIGERLRSPAAALSGGQQQRVAIGRALYAGGAAIIADEPLSALDRRRAGAALQLIVERHDTVVMAMHDVDMALDVADRIIAIADGRLVFDRPTKSVTRAELVGLFDESGSTADER